MSAESSFLNAVANFTHGDRYDNYLRVVRLGLNALHDPNAVFNYILMNAPPPQPNPAKIRNAIDYALTNDRIRSDGYHRHKSSSATILSAQERQERRRLPLPQSVRRFVPVTLHDYGRTTAFTGTTTIDIIGKSIRMSDDELHLDEEAYRRQAAAQLRAMHPNSRIWAGAIIKDEAVRNRLGIRYAKTSFDGKDGIVEADDLATRLESVEGMAIPCHISLNPLTGKQGKTSSGAPSFDCLSTIAAFHYVLIEFDNLKGADGLPSQEQIDVVAGLIDYAYETDKFLITCATWTGGKSIHVCLRIPDGDLNDYRKQCAALADLFSSADNTSYRIDTSGWTTGANAATHFRLAGAIRPETGRRARLLYCTPQ